MAHHDSSHQRTILWVIIPVAISLTLLFVWRNHQLSAPKPAAPATEEIERAPSSATHVADPQTQSDTTHSSIPAEPAVAH